MTAETPSALMVSAREKAARLHDRLRELQPLAVAFSGGVDSSFLLAAAVDACGPDAIAVIGVSPSLAPLDLEAARSLARSLGAELREVTTRELDDPDYVRNAGDRCYHCKAELFARIRDLVSDVDGRTIVDGTNASDASDHRPGRRAGAEQGVRSPLAEVGLEKEEIRYLARERGLGLWDKPEAACLASRLPVGTPVTVGALQRIDAAERALAAYGFRRLRVRHHGPIARIEVGSEELEVVLEHREAIVAAVRGVGYDYVVLDLDGYRRGGAAH